MIKFKKAILFTLIFGVYTPSIVASAMTTVTGYKSINNSSESTYKTSEESIENIVSSMNRPSDYKEILNYNDNKQVVDSNKELSYLLENNILSSDVDISYDRSKANGIVSTYQSKRFDYESNSSIGKSDFLATLSKAVYGVQESRYLVFQSSATREVDGKTKALLISSDYTPEGYQGDDDTFDFSKGDYHIYVTPNVYELYYKTLINKGVVSVEEFSDLEFINDMKYYGLFTDGKTNLPLWEPSLKYYNVSSSNYNTGVNVMGEEVLGKGFELEETDSTAELKLVDHSWFLNEKMLTIDALKYIEKALRASEKDMTKTEAELVNYKYGAMYLDRVDESSKDIVMYLVAKGILNFENKEEFDSIYKDFTGSFFRTLMYRIANKDARLDFSTIQLTDSDNYWLSQGYYSNQVNLYKGTAPSFTTTVKEVEQVKESRSIFNLFGLIKSRDITITAGPTEYEVERSFNNNLIYTYKGVTLSSSTKAEGDIVSAQVSSDGNHLVVKFKVKAVNPTVAIAMIDANMTVEKNSVTTIGSIPAVSEVKWNKVSSTYVSQSALRNLSGSPILISNDKYLINKENNSKAILLEDNNIAIIGNEIVKTESNMVTGINNEVYYNFAIISKLLSQTMASSLDPNSWYVASNASTEVRYKFLSGNGSELESVYVNKFKSNSIGESSKPILKPFYNITLSNSTGNYLIQNISKDLGYSSEFYNYMIVEFDYVLPSSSDLPINGDYLNSVLNSEINMSDVYSKFYQKPNSSSLATIWDSNLLMSNALVNYMMGTSGVTYIRSGYIVPKVYILADLYEANQSHSVEDINKFFLDKVGVSKTLIDSYGSYVKEESFVENYFDYVGGPTISTGDSVFDAVRRERTLEVLPFRSVGSGNVGYIDFVKFSVLTTGQVYRNIEDADDLTVDEKEKTITFNLRTERKDTIDPMVLYTVDKNKDGTHTEFLATKVTNHGYADLVSLKSIDLIYNSAGGKEDKLMLKDGSGNFITVAEALGDIGDNVFGDNTFWTPTLSRSSGDLNLVGTLEPNSYYYSNGKYYKTDDNGNKEEISEKSNIELLTSHVIKMFPMFTVPVILFTPDKNNVLGREDYNPTLDIGNIVNGGIASQIVDSIVYENLEYVSYNELPKGAKVYIGDIMYTKSGEFLQSGVLTDSGMIAEMTKTNLNDNDSNSKIKTIVSKTIGNVSLFNRSASSSAKYGGPEVPLTDYITSAKFGSGFKGADYDKTLMLDSKGKLVVKRFMGSGDYAFGTPFSSYCIAFSLDNSVRFRAIDDTNTKFTVVRVINKNSDGFLEDVPFFLETLDYDEMDGLNFDITKELFKPSDNSGDLMKKFLDAYRLNTQRDLKELAKYWIRLICTVLSAFNLIMLMFRRSPLDVIVRDIKYSASSKYNIDLYTILTFGFQSVDVEMPIWKGVLVSGVLVAIASFATIGSL